MNEENKQIDIKRATAENIYVGDRREKRNFADDALFLFSHGLETGLFRTEEIEAEAVLNYEDDDEYEAPSVKSRTLPELREVTHEDLFKLTEEISSANKDKIEHKSSKILNLIVRLKILHKQKSELDVYEQEISQREKESKKHADKQTEKLEILKTTFKTSQIELEELLKDGNSGQTQIENAKKIARLAMREYFSYEKKLNDEIKERMLLIDEEFATFNEMRRELDIKMQIIRAESTELAEDMESRKEYAVYLRYLLEIAKMDKEQVIPIQNRLLRMRRIIAEHSVEIGIIECEIKKLRKDDADDEVIRKAEKKKNARLQMRKKEQTKYSETLIEYGEFAGSNGRREYKRLEKLESQKLQLELDVKKEKKSGENDEQYEKRIEDTKKALETVIAEIEAIKSNDGYQEIVDILSIDYILDLRKQMDRGRFIETKGLNDEIEFVMACLRLNQPFMLVGDLGSGKTEMLKHIVKKYLIEIGEIEDKDYGNETVFVFSGSKESSIYDLMGRMKLDKKNVSLEDRMKMFIKEIEKMKKSDDPTIKAKYANFDIDNMDEFQLIKFASMAFDPGMTQTEFARGVLVQAIRANRPIIIDEIDQIPNDVLMRINDILTAKVGDKIRVQEGGDEEIEIGKGFVILGTANLKSEHHKERKDIDAAFGSRFIIKEHPYLSKEDTYSLILAYFANTEFATLDDKLTTENFKKFVPLVYAMKCLQDIWQGKYELHTLAGINSAGGLNKKILKKTVFSVRHLTNILDLWIKMGMEIKSIDEAIGHVLLTPLNKDDQLYIAEVLMRFGFFTGWDSEDFEQKLQMNIKQTTIETIQVVLSSSTFDRSSDPYLTEMDKVGQSWERQGRKMGIGAFDNQS